MTQILWQHQKILWVHGLQSGLTWKINLDRNLVPIRPLNCSTLLNNLLHSVFIVSITFFRQLIVVILLWSKFSVTTTYLACYTFKIATRCKERKSLISKVGSQQNRHKLANHYQIIQLYVYYMHHFEPF